MTLCKLVTAAAAAIKVVNDNEASCRSALSGIYASGLEFEYVGQPDMAQDKDQHSVEHQIFDLLIGKHALYLHLSLSASYE